MATHDVLHGIGVSAGTAAAPAAIVQPAPGVDTSEPGSVDAAADGARVREALAAVSSRLSERAAKAPEETKAILKATAQLAGDRGLAKAVDKKLKKGLGLTQAVHDAVEGRTHGVADDQVRVRVGRGRGGVHEHQVIPGKVVDEARSRVDDEGRAGDNQQ